MSVLITTIYGRWRTITILGLPACHRLRIVELNCAVNLLQKKLMQQKTSTTEHQKVQDDLEKLKPFSSREDLINAYPDCFEGIRRFPGTYHITLRKDARPVVHAPRKCPIAGRMAERRNHHPCRRTYRLGIFTGLLP